MPKNSYTLISNLLLADLDKLVQDIAAIFYMQPINKQTAANLQINICHQEQIINIRLIAAADNKLLAERSLLSKTTGLRHRLKLTLFKVLADIYQERQADWGILSGVRPIKLVQLLIEQGLADDQVRSELSTEYMLSEHKIKLAMGIAKRENTILSAYTDKKDICVYIGVPYCNSKCSYCSFPSGLLPTNDSDTELFLQTIEQDIQSVVQLANERGLRIRSLYIGGGTPTSFANKHFTFFVDMLRPLAEHRHLREFTFEAGRVDSLNEYKLDLLQDLGITRISLNPQTFNAQTLLAVGRQHTLAEFYHWYEYVREHFAWQINMDIILGLPGERLDDVAHTLSEAKRLDPDSLTVHVLAFKKDAQLFTEHDEYYHSNRQIDQMVELSRATAEQMGLQPYYLYRQGYILGNQENIGYAQDGYTSLYNIMIMREKHMIIGVGPSSKTKLVAEHNKIETFFMPKNINTYIEKSSDNFAKRKVLVAQYLS